MKPLTYHRTTWLLLRWPAEVDHAAVLAALHGLNGASTRRRRHPLVLVAIGRGGGVEHWLGVPGPRAGDTRAQLEAAIPGLAAAPQEHGPELRLDRCWRAWINTRRRPLETGRSEPISRGLLTALASAGHNETLALRWVLAPVQRPRAPSPHRSFDPFELATQPSDLSDRAGRGQRRGRGARPGGALASFATTPADRYTANASAGYRGYEEGEARRAKAAKQGVAAWRASLHIGVRTAGGRRRQRQLLGRVSGAVRSAQHAGAQPGFRPAPTRRHWRPTAGWAPRPLLINVAELAGLAGWPIGPTEQLGVDRVRSRLLPPDRRLPRHGRVVAEATYPTAAGTALTQTAEDALHHTLVLGPTGTGKTTLLQHLAAQDITDGRSVVVIEPRGDLIADLLTVIPDHRVDDVVVIDPTDTAVVGLNPLAVPGVPPEVRVDHIVAVFKGLWADSWGPRTQDILTSGLLTLTAAPQTSLAALPALLTDAEFRAGVLARTPELGYALDSFWAWFHQLGEAEQAVVLAPVMNKLRAFLLRSSLRHVVGQATPRFDFRDIYRRRRVVLVNLALGSIGSEAAALLGAFFVSHLWQTLLGRAATPPEQRHPVMVYADEFQSYTRLPTDFGDVLAEARGLGVGLTLAHQHLGQLPHGLRDGVLANARSKVIFSASHDDAATLVRSDPRLKPADVADLGAFEIYAALMAHRELTPWASGHTLSPPQPIGTAEPIRQRSRDRWAVPGAVIDADLEGLNSARYGRPAASSDRPPAAPAGLGRRPREDRTGIDEGGEW